MLNSKATVECCNTCRKKLDLIKYDYSKGGCEHSSGEGFCCLAFADEGIACQMIGGNPEIEVCECYVKRRDYE